MNLKTEVAFGQPRKIAVITETNNGNCNRIGRDNNVSYKYIKKNN